MTDSEQGEPTEQPAVPIKELTAIQAFEAVESGGVIACPGGCIDEREMDREALTAAAQMPHCKECGTTLVAKWSEDDGGSATEPEVVQADANARVMDADENTIAFEANFTVHCHCGELVELHTMQKTVVCQGPKGGHCGQEWRLR